MPAPKSQPISKLHGLITWPENASAVRLADAIQSLERHIANLHALKGTTGATTMAAGSEVTKLRQENARLSANNSAAVARLDALLEQLEPLLEEPATTKQAAA